MKRFFKIKHKKSPKPPLQPIPSENHANIAAGPSDPPGAELDVTIPGDGGRNVSDNDLEADRTDLTVPPNEGEMEGPRVPFQDEADVGQEPPASEASISGVAVGGAGCGDQLASKCSRSLRWTQHSWISVSLPPLAEGSSDTGGRPGQRRHPRVCEHVMMASALVYRASVAKKTHEHTLLRGAKSNTEKFGPLKLVLEKICALFADRTVRLRSLT